MATVDWTALGEGVLAAFAGAVGFVAAFSLVVLATSRIAADRRQAGRARMGDIVLLAGAGVLCLAGLAVALVMMMDKT